MNDNTIYYNIEDSNYFVEYENKYRFYFSSQYYKDKFTNRLEDFIDTENYKLKARFNLELDFKEMLLFHLYQRIEKRGFRIEHLDDTKWAKINNYEFVSLLTVS